MTFRVSRASPLPPGAIAAYETEDGRGVVWDHSGILRAFELAAFKWAGIWIMAAMLTAASLTAAGAFWWKWTGLRASVRQDRQAWASMLSESQARERCLWMEAERPIRRVENLQRAVAECAAGKR